MKAINYKGVRYVVAAEEPPIGATVRGYGKAASEISEYFGAGEKTIDGIYIGEGRVYRNRMLYPLNLARDVKILKPPTPATIAKAQQIISRMKTNKEVHRKKQDKEETEREAKYEQVIALLIKHGFKGETHKLKLRISTSEAQPILEKLVADLEKLGYKFYGGKARESKARSSDKQMPYLLIDSNEQGQHFEFSVDLTASGSMPARWTKVN